MWLNYNENYAVSQDGEVMNRKTNKILKGLSDARGYLRVGIHGKMIRVHRIVADTFFPKIDLPGLEIDHINRNPLDNRASNLRWCSRSDNCRNKNSTNIYKNHNHFIVKFSKKGKNIYCKTFKTMEEAIAARDAFKLTDEFIS